VGFFGCVGRGGRRGDRRPVGPGPVRKAGASWGEIAAAAGVRPADARRLYEMTLARQKAFGYAEAHRHDPGVPDL
jgi:hypothetical protein